MLEDSRIEAVLLEFLRTELLDAETTLLPDTRLEEIGIDSFALLEILVHAERSFGIAIPAASLGRDSLRSVREIAIMVSKFSQLKP